MHSFSKCIAVLCFAAVCPAAELYTFSYTAQSGPVQSFSFSFVSSGYLANGDTPVFTPFTVTDGTNALTLTNGVAQTKDSMSCFIFGTSGAGLGEPGFPPFGGPCSLTVGGPGNQGGFLFNLNGPLPTAPGTYQPSTVMGSFGTPSGLESIYVNGFTPTGTMTLTISDVSAPEPASFALIGGGFALLGATHWRRRKATI